MLKRLVVAFLLLTSAFGASAFDYTDVYYNAAQPGKGLFLVQSDAFQFIAFFIYGPNNNPTWYTAQITDDGTGRYAGPLYKTTGTFFASPWNAADLTVNNVGTATFQPTDKYHAMLTYTVTGVGTVTETVVRQTLTPYQMTGDFSGAMAGSVSDCNNPANNVPAFRGRYDLNVTQADDTSATLTFTFVDPTYSGIVCTVPGSVTHFGRIYQVAGTLSCTGPGQDNVPRPATIESFHPTSQGIEGKLTAATGGGCTGSLHFSAVFNRNN